MKHTRQIAMAVAAVLAICGAGCSKKAPPAAPKIAPADKVWTPEEMAKDPEGYLRWADKKVQVQIDICQQRLATIQGRLAQISARQTELAEQMRDAQNIHDRMEQALRRSQEEDRLPIRMGGRTFETNEAQQIISQSVKWIEDRRPLAEAYDQAVGRLATATGDLRGQIASMNTLRERLTLDIERVRLNEGVAELDQLRKTETDLSGFARVLAGTDDTIGLASLPKDDKPGTKVDFDTFLKN
jgi:hypothetical protein